MLYLTQSIVGAGLLVSLAFAYQDETQPAEPSSAVPVSCAQGIAALGDGIVDDGTTVEGCEKVTRR